MMEDRMWLSWDYTMTRIAEGKDWRPPEGTVWEILKRGIRGLESGVYTLTHSKSHDAILTSLDKIEDVPKKVEFINIVQWNYLVDRGYLVPHVRESPDWRPDQMIPEDFHSA
jgi:hypothetical protein